MNIQKVLVAGCGTMGSQIAMQAARYGYSVQVYDLSQQAREKAEQYAHSWFNRQVSKGRMTWEEAQAAVARLTFNPVRDATTAHQHGERKALRREKAKKIALGHKEDDYEEEQKWEQSM